MRDLEVEWMSTEHIYFSVIVALPTLAIYGLLIPIVAYVLVKRHKNELDDDKTLEEYGVLYNGYKKRFYYWESINMIKKVGIIIVSEMIRMTGLITQALMVFLLLIILLISNILLEPYALKISNNMEMMSIIVSMLTVYCALFYISDNPEVYNSDSLQVQQADNGRKYFSK